MDPPSPTTSSPPEKASSRARQYKYLNALLIRGFLEWAEYVDVEPDTIEDLLDGLDEQDFDCDEDDEDDGPQNADSDAEETEDDLAVRFAEERERVLSELNREQIVSDVKERGADPPGPTYVINEYVLARGIPVSKLLVLFDSDELRNKCHKTQLFLLKVAMYQILQKRIRLPYNTVDDAVNLIKKSTNILILSGAGISVSCGIPDFRSRDGIYSMLQERGEYELDDPQQMFDIDYFKENPSVFYSFASQIYPSNFIPSPCHRFIKLVENQGKLLRNYTQNIDTLETRAGVRKVVQCHGSFATASCINCRVKVPGNAIEAEIMSRTIPFCTSCTTTPSTKIRKKGKKKKNSLPWESDGEEEPEIPAFPSGIMKPDITFFGEKLSHEFDNAFAADKPVVDLLIIIGTSLKVSPVADMPTHLRHSIPQIVINKTPILHHNADIVLLGNADEIVQYLCHKLEWELPELPPQPSSSTKGLEPDRPNLRKRPSATFDQEPRRVGNSHVWLFEGAEPGDIVKIIETRYGGQPGQSTVEDHDASFNRFKKVRTN
ncbi:DHS-like NAD/FAD-binding domain-containing protein [Cytidiella melzeri]|nr:DHS-like NAD/FAD-binding domain-containing protein [Cytidiella melzeri]